MTRKDEIELEVRNQAVRLYPKCAALFELPHAVYAQIQKDNVTRKSPYRISEARIRSIIHSMPEFQERHLIYGEKGAAIK